MWTDPAGHVYVTGEIVTSGTMNDFIRKNLQSSRFWQRNSGQKFSGSAGLTTTTETLLGATHYGLLDATPDEDFRMQVIVAVAVNNTVGGANPINGAVFTVYDDGGTVLGYALSEAPANGDQAGAAVVSANFVAGANHGFKVTGTPFANTRTDLGYDAIVNFTPQT